MIRCTEPTAWARWTLCTASNSAATSPELLRAHRVPGRGQLGLTEAGLLRGGPGDGGLQRLDPRIGARAVVDLAGEHDGGGRRTTDHRREGALDGEHLHVVVQLGREHHEGPAVVARHDAQHERTVEVDDRPADLGAVLELQPSQ